MAKVLTTATSPISHYFGGTRTYVNMCHKNDDDLRLADRLGQGWSCWLHKVR